MSQTPLLLVGCGDMGLQYAKILQTLQVPFDAIGRRPESCATFAAKTGVTPLSGGIEAALAHTNKKYQSAIVTVNLDQLAAATQALINAGVQRILVEKPAGLNAAEITATAKLAKEKGVQVFVAYNRRFYASTRRAREIIKADGGATSFFFEFTEWSHVIEKLPSPESVKKSWFLANSTHVCDLAFFLGGFPASLTTHVRGGLDWHPQGAQFVGCGVSRLGALFSYHSNWESAGRWGVEVCTEKRKLYLRPLEGLNEQIRGQIPLTPVVLEDRYDKDFKPGLYEQTRAFVENRDADLLTLTEHAQHAATIYTQIVVPNAAGAHA
jgi:predicted dehydrogenase